MKEKIQKLTQFLLICLGIILCAIAWPFIYPGLDYIMAIIGFDSTEFLLKAGSLYGEINKNAPGFFKGMAIATEALNGEHPAIASLSYMTKAELLLFLDAPIYVLEIILFMFVTFLNVTSRLLPWHKVKAVINITAIVITVLPLIAIFLSFIALCAIPYIQAWSSGLTDFIFLVILSPAVMIKTLSPMIGVIILARYLIPRGLLLSGQDSTKDAYVCIVES